eukprot:scaffold163783_cov32-Tisochrysis_lutea.AAC.1
MAPARGRAPVARRPARKREWSKRVWRRTGPWNESQSGVSGHGARACSPASSTGRSGRRSGPRHPFRSARSALSPSLLCSFLLLTPRYTISIIPV